MKDKIIKEEDIKGEIPQMKIVENKEIFEEDKGIIIIREEDLIIIGIAEEIKGVIKITGKDKVVIGKIEDKAGTGKITDTREKTIEDKEEVEMKLYTRRKKQNPTRLLIPKNRNNQKK